MRGLRLPHSPGSWRFGGFIVMAVNHAGRGNDCDRMTRSQIVQLTEWDNRNTCSLTMSPASERQRRHEPGKRDRIVETAMAVIVSEGLSGLSHRKVAAAADVPLGSITYRLASLDELAEEAFARYVAQCSDHFEKALATSRSAKSCRESWPLRWECIWPPGISSPWPELYLGSVRNPQLAS